MNIVEFKNTLKRLRFIDRDKLPCLTDEEWALLRDDPVKFILTTAPDEKVDLVLLYAMSSPPGGVMDMAGYLNVALDDIRGKTNVIMSSANLDRKEASAMFSLMGGSLMTELAIYLTGAYFNSGDDGPARRAQFVHDMGLRFKDTIATWIDDRAKEANKDG